MLLNKKLLIVIGIMLILGIGGKVLMDHQKVKEQEAEVEKIEAERMSVGALKENFADIKSVEFQKSGKNEKTGYFSMVVKKIHKDGEFVVFSFGFVTNRPYDISAWQVIDEEKVQKPGKTRSKVKVIYTNEIEEEI